MGLCVAAMLALALPSAAPAAVTLTPTRFDDPVGGTCQPTNCSLRQAAAAAASDTATIRLSAGRYELTQANPITLSNPNFSVTLVGAGARATTIDGNGITKVLVIEEGTTAATVSDVTITGGSAIQANTPGGGIDVESTAGLTLSRSAVIGNRAANGGGISTDGALDVIASTIAGNVAESVAGSSGGGLFSVASNSTTIRLINTTFSGNTAHDTGSTDGSQGGGLFINTGDVTTRNVTFARNRAADGGGLYNSDGNLAMFNTIIADSLAGGACGPTLGHAGTRNLDDDNTCGLLAAQGDKPGADPQLGVLANNGGPTDTHRMSPSSPALNAGAACETTDQRGITRPQLGACDIGALEYRQPTLTVIKRVVNDQGGTLEPGDFSVHVRAGGADVGGSPQPGTATGRVYTLAAGTYTVGEDADDRYAASFSGACNAAGVVTLTEAANATCTITNADKPPVAGEVVNAVPERGTVRIKLPGRRRFRVLREGDQLPVGTVVDTLRGRVTLFAAANKQGGTSESLFYAGIFRIGQTKSSKPITVLTLVEKLTGCKATGKASTAAKRKKKRRLWGNGSGRFRTKGRHSAATVVGTKWLVEDRCDSTLTRVVRGKVKVRDFAKKKTVTVRKGKRYIARAGG